MKTSTLKSFGNYLRERADSERHVSEFLRSVEEVPLRPDRTFRGLISFLFSQVGIQEWEGPPPFVTHLALQPFDPRLVEPCDWHDGIYTDSSEAVVLHIMSSEDGVEAVRAIYSAIARVRPFAIDPEVVAGLVLYSGTQDPQALEEMAFTQGAPVAFVPLERLVEVVLKYADEDVFDFNDLMGEILWWCAAPQ